MFIEDLGAAFGGPSLLATRKMDLDAWRREPVWADAPQCIANVTSERDASDGLDRPHIQEDGRRLLSDLLGALDDRQIAAIFTAARADHRGPLEQWVAAFQQRREEIAHPVPADSAFRCPM